jgi:hypothetical protein
LTWGGQSDIIAKPLGNTANTNPVSFGSAEKIVFRETSQRRARKQPPLSSLVAERSLPPGVTNAGFYVPAPARQAAYSALTPPKQSDIMTCAAKTALLKLKYLNNSRVVSKQLTQNDTNQSSSHNSPNPFQMPVPACLGRSTWSS